MIYNGKQIQKQGQYPAYPNSIPFSSSNKISLGKCGLVLNVLFKMLLLTVSSLVSKIEKLGVTQLDGKQAAMSSDMQKLYNAALANLSIS